MSNNNKTPAIRFKGFTDTWEQREFGDLCKIVTKQTGFDYTATIKESLLTSPSEDTLPYLQTKNFTGISIDYNTDYFIPKSVAKEFPKINLDEKCLLFSIVGASVGNIGLFPGEKHCFLSGAICVSKLINQNDADYLYHFMCSDNGQIQIHNCTKGGAQATVTIEDIRSFAVLLPTESERSKIGTLLTNIDFLITLHQRKCDKLIQFKAAMLQKMFPQNGADKPEIRFKGFTDAWEQRKVEDICTNISAGGDIDKSKLVDSSKYPVIANALTNDGIVGYYNDDFRIKAPAVTVTGRGDVGHAKARKIDFTPVVRLLALETKHDVDFLENAINTISIVNESTGVPQLTVPQLSQYVISVPPTIEEEKAIGEYLLSFDNLITLHQRKCDKYKSIKAGLIRKLFP